MKYNLKSAKTQTAEHHSWLMSRELDKRGIPYEIVDTMTLGNFQYDILKLTRSSGAINYVAQRDESLGPVADWPESYIFEAKPSHADLRQAVRSW